MGPSRVGKTTLSSILCEKYNLNYISGDSIINAFINIYPPGIPLVVPGEIMNDKLIDDVIKAVNSGLEVDGLYFDPDAHMWKFVAVL